MIMVSWGLRPCEETHQTKFGMKYLLTRNHRLKYEVLKFPHISCPNVCTFYKIRILNKIEAIRLSPPFLLNTSTDTIRTGRRFQSFKKTMGSRRVAAIWLYEVQVKIWYEMKFRAAYHSDRRATQWVEYNYNHCATPCDIPAKSHVLCSKTQDMLWSWAGLGPPHPQRIAAYVKWVASASGAFSTFTHRNQL